jgi:hypothetical protein
MAHTVSVSCFFEDPNIGIVVVREWWFVDFFRWFGVIEIWERYEGD